jgi:hypothetical protein
MYAVACAEVAGASQAHAHHPQGNSLLWLQGNCLCAGHTVTGPMKAQQPWLHSKRRLTGSGWEAEAGRAGFVSAVSFLLLPQIQEHTDFASTAAQAIEITAAPITAPRPLCTLVLLPILPAGCCWRCGCLVVCSATPAPSSSCSCTAGLGCTFSTDMRDGALLGTTWAVQST